MGGTEDETNPCDDRQTLWILDVEHELAHRSEMLEPPSENRLISSAGVRIQAEKLPKKLLKKIHSRK